MTVSIGDSLWSFFCFAMNVILANVVRTSVDAPFLSKAKAEPLEQGNLTEGEGSVRLTSLH
jgi:hypothetical protein